MGLEREEVPNRDQLRKSDCDVTALKGDAPNEGMAHQSRGREETDETMREAESDRHHRHKCGSECNGIACATVDLGA